MGSTPTDLKWGGILVPSFIFIFSRDLIFHGLNIIIYNNIIKIILRGRGKSRIDPGSEDACTTHIIQQDTN